MVLVDVLEDAPEWAITIIDPYNARALNSVVAQIPSFHCLVSAQMAGSVGMRCCQEGHFQFTMVW